MTDRKDALFALQQEQTELRQVQWVLCESGYVGTPLSQGVGDILGPQVKVELAKRTEPGHLILEDVARRITPIEVTTRAMAAFIYFSKVASCCCIRLSISSS